MVEIYVRTDSELIGKAGVREGKEAKGYTERDYMMLVADAGDA
jgi:hypothetical protein